ERDLLEPLCWAFSAGRGILVLAGSGAADSPALYEWKCESDENGTPVAGTLLLEQMVRDPRPMLWNRASKAAMGSSCNGENLVGPEVNALLAAPLVAFQRLIGVLCLTSGDKFEEQHLRFLRKTVGLIAGLLSNAVNAREQASEARQRRAEIHLEHNMVG